MSSVRAAGASSRGGGRGPSVIPSGMDFFPVVNPATGETVRTYPAMPMEEAHAAIEQAHAAFLGWRRTSFADRARLMRAAAARFRERKDALAALMTVEMGKTVREGGEEVEKCALGCEYFADRAERLLAPEPVDADDFRASGGAANERAYVTANPLGVVLALMPWNFPLWQAVRFLAPGLMAGNACVLKHADNVPGCALALEELFRAAGFPTHLFRAVLVGIPAVEGLITHSRVAAVTLTGSVPAGRSVAGIAGRALKKCVLELGGSDAYVILEDADLDLAAETCARARLLNTGQSCIAAKRFIVPQAVRAEFERRLVEHMREFRAGDPTAPDTRLGPLASRRHRDNLHAQVRASVERGARLMLGGEVPPGPGAFYPPTILADVVPGMVAYTEELFGPVASILPAADEADALRIANDTAFGLGAAVFTRDLTRGERIAAEVLEAGAAFVNTNVRSMPALPFGGIKDSGYGRELSAHGIREFVNLKTVLVKTSG